MVSQRRSGVLKAPGQVWACCALELISGICTEKVIPVGSPCIDAQGSGGDNDSPCCRWPLRLPALGLAGLFGVVYFYTMFLLVLQYGVMRINEWLH